MFKVFGFYKFIKIKSLKKKKIFLQKFLTTNDTRGTIIISQEGLNGTISSNNKNIEKAVKKIKFLFLFKKFDCENTSKSLFQPFHKPKVKIKKEVVPMNFTLNPNERNIETHLDPKKWNDLIKKKDTHIIDTRKSFEYDVGTFKKSINPDIDNFRDFPKYLNKLNKKKPVAMFCTGGIRCEKSTSYLKQIGFKNVFHLEGGILKYLENVKSDENEWNGECFVFDYRVSINNNLQKGQYDMCYACRMPLNEEDKKKSFYLKGQSCHNCYNKTTTKQKNRFSEREKQMKLSKTRNSKHLGPND